MFSDITTNSNLRLIEVRDYLDFIKANIPPPPTPTPKSLVAAKGLFFVHLYGAYEYTVYSTVSKSIEAMNSLSIKINDCKSLLLCIALNPQCDAIASATKKRWEKRWDLFAHLENNTLVDINSALMPTDGKNIRYYQLESIWKSFCISEPIVPRREIRGIIEELVENRNKIAHGTQSPHDVGSSNSIDDLYKKYNDISEQCTYIINVFKDYIQNKQYLKSISVP